MVFTMAPRNTFIYTKLKKMSCCGIEHFAETHTRYLLGGCDAIMQNSRSIYSSRPSATCPAESLTCATRAEIILQFCATRDKLELPNAFRRWAPKNDAEPFAPQAVFFSGVFFFAAGSPFFVRLFSRQHRAWFYKYFYHCCTGRFGVNSL